jgi:hypothetical protein
MFVLLKVLSRAVEYLMYVIFLKLITIHVISALLEVLIKDLKIVFKIHFN